MDVENKKAEIYMAPANIYKLEKPKYIELYSKKPPSIAPKILDDKACEIDCNFNNSLEKAIPENRIGSVNIIGIIILLTLDDIVAAPCVNK